MHGVCPTSHNPAWTLLTVKIDNAYQSRLELKSNTDRTLGVGVMESESAVLVLTAATMMKAHVDLERVERFDPEYVPYPLLLRIWLTAHWTD